MNIAKAKIADLLYCIERVCGAHRNVCRKQHFIIVFVIADRIDSLALAPLGEHITKLKKKRCL